MTTQTNRYNETRHKHEKIKHEKWMEVIRKRPTLMGKRKRKKKSSRVILNQK